MDVFTQYGSVKGEREKVSNTSFTPYPLTFSHTAYPNRIVSSPVRVGCPPHKSLLMRYFSLATPLLRISVNTAPLASFVKPLHIHQWPLLTVNSQQSTLLWNIFYLKVPRRKNQGYSQYTQQYSGCKQNNLLRYQEMAKENL
jgi:hypothetical protein